MKFQSKFNRKFTVAFAAVCILLQTALISAVYASTAIKKITAETSAAPNSEKIISLTFRQISIRQLFKILAEAACQKIVVDDNADVITDINLKSTTWRKAMREILKTNNLTAVEKEGTIFITADKLAKLHAAKNSFKKNQTAAIKINYAKAAELAGLLTKNQNILSPEGIAIADPRTNMLLLKDKADKIAEIKQYLKQLDIPMQQVKIEARIVYADENFARELGLKFGTAAKKNNESFAGMNMDFPMKITDPGHIAIAIAKLQKGTLLDLELAALENEGRARIVSCPKLVTADRETAYIEAGEEVPYQESTSSGATSVVFKKAVLGLKVTPEIFAHDKINLRLQLNQDKVTSLNVNGVPAIQTRELVTEVLAGNKETIVLGGIYEETANNEAVKVPFLSAIPVLGLLFQNRQKQTERKELLIFVTPQIIESTV